MADIPPGSKNTHSMSTKASHLNPNVIALIEKTGAYQYCVL